MPFSEVEMDDDALFTDLIHRIQSGDEAAAAALVEQYEPQVRREVRMRLRMRDPRLRRVFDSMDIVQSVLQSFFLRVAAGQYDLNAPDQLRGLLVAMARNKLAEQVRYQQRDRRDVRRIQGGANSSLEDADPGPTASRVIAGRELLQEFRARLSEEERPLADLRVEGRSWMDIANLLGGTAEGRRKQYSRAVDRIAIELGVVDSGVADSSAPGS
jgi:RNA polymerase sigma factor (sigma-70 family)